MNIDDVSRVKKTHIVAHLRNNKRSGDEPYLVDHESHQASDPGKCGTYPESRRMRRIIVQESTQ